MKHLYFPLKVLLLGACFSFLGDTIDIGDVYAPATDLPRALNRVDRGLRNDLATLEQHLVAYHEATQNHHTPVEELRTTHRNTRLAYKRVEYLLAYAQPATVTRHLNGAPLPKTEPGVPEIVVIEPGGLQTLDELVFSSEIDRKAIEKLSLKLLGDYRRLHRQVKGLRLQHRHVFESLQQQIVRLFTLGLTGFDTPASGAAIPEAREVLAVTSSIYHEYANSLATVDQELASTISTALERGHDRLKTDSFETFDRLAFLREVVNPLTASLPRAQRILGIESTADNKGLPAPVNPAATYLFDHDYLDADYFANLPKVATAEKRQQLGRLLFFDPILSQDLTASCASCHRPELAFTDGYAKSLRASGEGTVLRNSPTLVNSVYAEKYFYDLREEFLERQVKHVVVDKHEFATDFITLQNRLAESDEYRQLFAEAYAEQPAYQLSRWSISDALARYLASLQGNNSTFDRYARSETEKIAPEIRRGFNLFMGKAACGTCHFAPTFSGLVPPYYQESESEVLGVPDSVAWVNARVDADLGRVANNRPEDEVYFNTFAFKTPTVRNSSVTAPYMHNGVYQTLEEVMNFYNRGGGAGIGIDLPHQTLPPAPLGLNEGEISDIISFMRSLEDYQHLKQQPATLPIFARQPAWNNRPVGGLRQ